MKLHIVAPDIRAGDAVGNHCLYLAKALRHQGLETALYARRHDPDQMVHPPEELLTSVPLSNTDDVLLISYSTFQPRLAELMALPCRKLVYFHGVTPTELLLDHDPEAAYWSSRALLQIPLLAQCERIIANSQWNLQALQQQIPDALLASRCTVIPPITPDMPLFHRTFIVKDRRQHDPLRMLTVGRIAPHKRLEDIIQMTAMLRSAGTPSTLTIIGGTTCDDYAKELKQVIKSLNLTKEVHFRGHVSNGELSSAYAEADILISASLHEGFCIPVLEAMQFNLTTVIRNGTAATEITGTSGIFYNSLQEGVTAILNLIQQKKLETTSNSIGQAQKIIRSANIGNWLNLIKQEKQTHTL